MNIILLGLIQGFTEFLPVSSSGHLVIFEHFLGISNPDLSLEIALHLGTLGSVLVYFHKKIISLIKAFIGIIINTIAPKKSPFISVNFSDEKSMIISLIIAMIPTAIIGLFLRKNISDFHQLSMVGIALLFTSILLFASNISLHKKKSRTNKVSTWQGILIGIAQGIAVIPGISRSGSTVATALILGLNRQSAAEFSFLLAIPTILAATLLEFNAAVVFTPLIGLAVLTSFVSGLIAIHFFMEIIKRSSLNIFAFYCLFLGMLLLLFS